MDNHEIKAEVKNAAINSNKILNVEKMWIMLLFFY